MLFGRCLRIERSVVDQPVHAIKRPELLLQAVIFALGFAARHYEYFFSAAEIYLVFQDIYFGFVIIHYFVIFLFCLKIVAYFEYKNDIPLFCIPAVLINPLYPAQEALKSGTDMRYPYRCPMFVRDTSAIVVVRILFGLCNLLFAGKAHKPVY